MKQERIKRDVLVQDYEMGGLEMLHISNFIIVLKSTRIRIITFNSNWKTLFEAVTIEGLS